MASANQPTEAGPSTARNFTEDIFTEDINHAEASQGEPDPLAKPGVAEHIKTVSDILSKKKYSGHKPYSSEEKEKIVGAWHAFDEAGGKKGKFLSNTGLAASMLAKLLREGEAPAKFARYPENVQITIEGARSIRAGKEMVRRGTYTPFEKMGIYNAWLVFGESGTARPKSEFYAQTGISEKTLNSIIAAKDAGEF